VNPTLHVHLLSDFLLAANESWCLFYGLSTFDGETTGNKKRLHPAPIHMTGQDASVAIFITAGILRTNW